MDPSHLVALDVGRVQVHVVFGVGAVIKNGVDVFQVDLSIRLVVGPDWGVRLVETTATKDKPRTSGAKAIEASGKKGSEKRKKP